MNEAEKRRQRRQARILANSDGRMKRILTGNEDFVPPDNDEEVMNPFAAAGQPNAASPSSEEAAASLLSAPLSSKPCEIADRVAQASETTSKDKAGKPKNEETKRGYLLLPEIWVLVGIVTGLYLLNFTPEGGESPLGSIFGLFLGIYLPWAYLVNKSKPPVNGDGPKSNVTLVLQLCGIPPEVMTRYQRTMELFSEFALALSFFVVSFVLTLVLLDK